MITIDLSLDNAELYRGCNIREVTNGSGKPHLHLATPPDEALPIIRSNLGKMLMSVYEQDHREAAEVTITGKAPLEVYLTVCSIVSQVAIRLYYRKGKKVMLLQNKGE
jgi:hypothetical protein